MFLITTIVNTRVSGKILSIPFNVEVAYFYKKGKKPFARTVLGENIEITDLNNVEILERCH